MKFLWFSDQERNDHFLFWHLFTETFAHVFYSIVKYTRFKNRYQKIIYMLTSSSKCH